MSRERVEPAITITPAAAGPLLDRSGDTPDGRLAPSVGLDLPGTPPSPVTPCRVAATRSTAGVAAFPVLALLLGFLAAGSLPAAAAEEATTNPGFRRTPLAVSAAGRPGFTRLTAAETGLVFPNPLPVLLAAANNNLMNGSGLAAGDFDGDGWCDLYAAAIAGTNALFRNLGNGRFEDVTTRAGVGLPGATSTGALFGDLDGDGRPDLLVATLGTGVRGFRNEGDGRFRDVTAAAGLTSDTGSTSLALADVDGDGDLDLYVVNYGALSILRSGGRADLQQVNGQWVVTGPHAKRLRFVEGRLEELGEPDVLYLNDGRGRFEPVPWGSPALVDEEGRPRPAPWDFGLTVQMRDFNDDGAPDIYVCNDFQTVDRFWLNDGTGRFRALPRLAMRKQSFSSMGVDVADLNRDGFLDFFTTEMMSRDHRLRARQVVGMDPLVPVPGRLDNRPEVARNTLFIARGDGTYAELANVAGLAAADWAWQPLCLDVDLDGWEDILVGNGILFDVQDRDVLDRVRSFGSQPPEQARTNLLLYPPFPSPDLAFRNRGNLTFEEVGESWGFHATNITQGLALLDFDRDGDLDLAVNGVNGGLRLYRCDTPAPRLAVRLVGLPPNTAGIGAQIRVTGGPVPLQRQEILAGGRYLSGSDQQLVFAAGTPAHQLTIEVRWRSGRRSTLTHATPDSLYEVLEANAGPVSTNVPPPPSSTWFRDVTDRLAHTHQDALFDDFARQPLLTRVLSQWGPGVGWMDLDGDGADELVVGAGRGGALGVFRWVPSGAFQPFTPTRMGPMPDDLAGLVFWRGEGGRGVLLTALSNYESGATNGPAVIQWAFETGRPPAAAALTNVVLAGASPGPLALTDLDGAGHLRLFVGGRVIPGACPAPAGSVLFRQEGGRWVPDPATTNLFQHVGLVQGAVWSDLTGDGYPELILACEWGPIRIFRNEQGTLREWNPPVLTAGAPSSSAGGPGTPASDQPGVPSATMADSPDAVRRGGAGSLADLTGWWSGVAAGDFDGDGRMDLVVGNWGANDACQASPDRPLRVYYGDLGGLGVVDFIEAYHPAGLDGERPRRGLGPLSQALPFLTARYPTHASFSTATMAGLLESLPVQPAVVSVTTLATTVFLNRGTHFVARPLPPEAQWAPALGVCVADSDGDGHEDVFLSQNWSALRPEWPRLDAGRGLWLRGNGTGGFTAVPGQESGVLVYGEQRGAAVGDFNEDGRVDLVVAQNAGATRLFENVGARPGLRVRLLGPPGNPMAVNAVVRLGAGGRLGPARELHAGSGYGSQDSAVLVPTAPGPPDQIFVRWPGGKETTSTIPAGVREIAVSRDGRLRVIPPRPRP